ncbi:MAG: SoxR reducing system RseC family protein [Gammaproteobacteria bacterium]|jgi:sigma-E factor negative regulatory protein RseC|nr:SoxR reducing system RseC family protein [Gammaproteobacteria bacterium]
MSISDSHTQSAYVEQPATVVALQGATVTLSTIRLNTCQQCAMKVGCGQRMLLQAAGCERSQIELSPPANLPLQVGQEVRVAIPQSTFIRASLWVFMVPLLGMLLGAFIAQNWFYSEPAIALSGVVGLGVGVLLMRQRMRALQRHAQWQPHIIVDPPKN